MPIPESQLETWSRQGAVATAQLTHLSVRNALDSYQWPSGVNYEVYLQGSYKNTTNIRGDSDVDIVVQLNSTFQSDLTNLSFQERAIFEQYPDATYGWQDFRADVLKALRSYYGIGTISEGNKSIKVKAGSNRLSSDVVVSLSYKNYHRIYAPNQEGYIEGIVFYTIKENRRVINYPKVHYDNGVTKMSNTKGWYKPVVRIFKNARTYLINQGAISSNNSPSYFLECLIYNAQNNFFGNSYQYSFTNVVSWLRNSFLIGSYQHFICQNEQHLLFGTTEEQWNVNYAVELIVAYQRLWDNW